MGSHSRSGVAIGFRAEVRRVITFRCFTGKSGYFFSDDCLACGNSDDYRSIARRRTIDKAYRIAYITMLENVNDEIPITNDGCLVPSIVKSWEAEMVAAIVNQMTAQGELSADPDSLTDQEWAMRIKELEWIREEEAKANVKANKWANR